MEERREAITARYYFRTTGKERLSIVTFFLVLSVIVAVALSNTREFQKTRVVNVGAAYVPSGSIFGLRGITNFVVSPYWYESSLVNYSVPVADSDYILPTGFREAVYLPGYSNDRYTFIRTGYISGSGWFETWRTPNGGYIAFVHLSETSIRAVLAPIKVNLNLTQIQNYCITFKGDKQADQTWNQYCLNDDRTGLIADQMIRSQQGITVSNEVHTGGFYIGRSGWPTDPFYGNGLAGPYNAHLCVIYDQAGASWLYYASHQPKPQPFVFHKTLWYRWQRAHHKSISPYYGKHYSSTALAWNGNTSICNSVVAKWAYDRKNKVTSQRFEDCIVYTWSRPGYRPKIVKARHIA